MQQVDHEEDAGITKYNWATDVSGRDNGTNILANVMVSD